MNLLLSKGRVVLRYTRKCNFILDHKNAAEFDPNLIIYVSGKQGYIFIDALTTNIIVTRSIFTTRATIQRYISLSPLPRFN